MACCREWKEFCIPHNLLHMTRSHWSITAHVMHTSTLLCHSEEAGIIDLAQLHAVDVGGLESRMDAFCPSHPPSILASSPRPSAHHQSCSITPTRTHSTLKTCHATQNPL
jgi:hypothetical protein